VFSTGILYILWSRFQDINALVAFCERMEATEEAPPKMKNESDKIPKKSKRTRTEGSKWCEYCDMNNHNTKDCGHLMRIKKEREEQKVSQQENEVEQLEVQRKRCSQAKEFF
jgi:hypothetical protein